MNTAVFAIVRAHQKALGLLGCALLACSLRLASAQAPSGLSPSTAIPILQGTNSAAVTGLVTSTNPAVYYEFSLTGSVAAVTAALPGTSLAGSAILYLLDGSATNNQSVLSRLQLNGPVGGQTALWLDPGKYIVEVQQSLPSVDTAFVLTVSAQPQPQSKGQNDNALSDSNDLGELISPLTITDFIGSYYSVDWFHFHVSGPSRQVNVAVPLASRTGGAGIALALFEDPSHSGVGTQLGSDSGFSDALVTSELGAGDYYVKVFKYGGVDTVYQLIVSRVFTNDTAPFIVTQPQPVTIPTGQPASFSVVADGSGTLSYQWQLNETDLPGETQPSLTLLNSISTAGKYNVRVKVINAFGSTFSSDAVLTVTSTVVTNLNIDHAVIVSWPAAQYVGFVLESAFSTDGPWTPVSRPLVTVDNNYEAAVRTLAQAQFFRLHKTN